MMLLIEMQTFDGSWQLTDNFSKILGNTMDQLKRESPIVVCEIFKFHRYNKIAYSKVTGMGDFASNAICFEPTGNENHFIISVKSL